MNLHPCKIKDQCNARRSFNELKTIARQWTDAYVNGRIQDRIDALPEKMPFEQMRMKIRIIVEQEQS